MEGLIAERAGVVESRRLASSAIAVDEWLRDARERIEPAFVYHLLDFRHPPESASSLHPQRLVARELRPQLSVVRRADLAHAPDICPHLLTVAHPDSHGFIDEPLVRLLIGQCLERPFNVEGDYLCGWLVSRLAPESLARGIERSIITYDPVKGTPSVLPMFEPHRHALLLDDADIKPQAHWMDETFCWLFHDASGTLRSVNRQGSLNRSGRFRLPMPSWKRQQRVPTARLGLLALSRTGQPIPKDAERRADHWLSIAESCGLQRIEDQILFVLNGLTLAPGWHLHPACCQALREAAANGGSFAEQFLTLDDRVLEAIAKHPAME